MSLLVLFQESTTTPPGTPVEGNPIGLLLTLTYSDGGTPAPTPVIGNPIGLLLALTYSEAEVVTPPVGDGRPDTYSYGPSKEAIRRMYETLFGKRKPKKPKRKAKLERVATELLRQVDPGPDLPPLDLSALVAAIKLLDEPVNLKPTIEQKNEIIVALLTEAQRIRSEDEEEMEELAMALWASSTMH